jgi:hypothetical protein
MGISINTGRVHLQHVFTKLGVRSQNELIERIRQFQRWHWPNFARGTLCPAGTPAPAANWACCANSAHCPKHTRRQAKTLKNAAIVDNHPSFCYFPATPLENRPAFLGLSAGTQ